MEIIDTSRDGFAWTCIRYTLARPIILKVILVLIPCAGFCLSFFLDYKLAFARSGSLLVTIAVTGVYLNQIVLRKVEQNNLYRDMLSNGQKITDFKPSNPDVNFDKSEAITAITAHIEKQANGAQKENNDLYRVTYNFTKIEFLAGIIGTVIWGFGDILFS
ncbi:MAG: hypothetical protein COB29_13150 [Sulfitobacter sp.]|nr:MAG: hypothetical protein COB29_13150 [Sulfitobacter sp.]